MVSPNGGDVEMVADAMKKGPKTFIEKRSWLTILLAFRRIIDFHVLTFHLLAVYAFWDLLVWDYPYGLQLMSSVFLAMNLMGILWCGIEIWQTLQDDSNPVPGTFLWMQPMGSIDRYNRPIDRYERSIDRSTRLMDGRTD